MIEESLSILKKNYSEIESHCNFQSTHLRKDANIETKRLVHNYLASAMSLVDHTRIYIKYFHGENELKSYKDNVQTVFAQSPLSSFIKDFRQYIQHFRLPEMTFQQKAYSIKSNITLRISTAELLKFSGWKTESKKFLRTKHPSFDLFEVLNTYQEKVATFYIWLFKEQSDHFVSEFLELSSLEKKLQDLYLRDLVTDLVLSRIVSFRNFEDKFHQATRRKYFNEFKEINELDRIDRIMKIIDIKAPFSAAVRNCIESIVI